MRHTWPGENKLGKAQNLGRQSSKLSDKDNVQMNDKEKVNNESILKNKVLYTSKFASNKHPLIFECSRQSGFKCPSFSG